MTSFKNGPVELAYLDQGDGDPVLLVHGFASNKEVNWVHPSWFGTLHRAGFRTIALDLRGHGESTKLYEPAQYKTEILAEDVFALIEHLGLPKVDLLGYSMGARISAFVTVKHQDRVRSLILGGVGRSLFEGRNFTDDIPSALEADQLAADAPRAARTFRAFAEQTKSDLKALAACMRGTAQNLSREEVATIRVPTLIAVGTKDNLAGNPRELAAMIPGSQVLDIPERDHMLAVGDKVFKNGAVDFLKARP
jgi:pimeloyl-ACP methyl ester carboxylesterase